MQIYKDAELTIIAEPAQFEHNQLGITINNNFTGFNIAGICLSFDAIEAIYHHMKWLKTNGE